VSILVANQVTKPLTKITATVGEVARGNWRAGVPGTERRDEVGDIARAVVMLETSLEERDQLRDNVLSQNGALLEREEQLRHQNVRFDAALNNMSQGLCMFDGERRLKVFNSRLLSMYERPDGAIAVGMPLATVLACLIDPDPASIDALAAESVETVELGVATSWTRSLADGRAIAISLQPMAGGGWVETHEDVTERRAAETRIAHLASHDVLTGLPNRLLFAQRLREAHATLRAGGRGYAVLCVDLDDFKGVNDTLGHAVGDALLCGVARRLESLASSGDTVARLGGDEFAIIHPQDDRPDGGERLAERIVAVLRQPFEAGGQGLVSAGSVGVAVGSDKVDDPQRALLNADLALYTAKTEGRGRYRLFEGEMETRFQHRQALERDLRVALAEGAIEVYYQPLFNIQTMTISGLEALARWRHPLRGFVSPGEFVPLAEEVGLIDQLGEAVLNQACRDASRWPEALKIAVNVSPVQFRSPGLCHSVVRALAASGLPSWRLELEITESVVLGDDPETLSKLHSLHDLGIKFSMDDFGTGFSSLSGLRNFPFDKIKLDQSFVRDAVVREDAAAIVRIVAELGRSLNMTTLAEGVETPEQLQALKDAGFAEAQGYLFSPAIPARDIPAFIDRSMPFRAVA
jgi:diguanylate cyclase (GGDEF)-like protein